MSIAVKEVRDAVRRKAVATRARLVAEYAGGSISGERLERELDRCDLSLLFADAFVTHLFVHSDEGGHSAAASLLRDLMELCELAGVDFDAALRAATLPTNTPQE